ncbi:MAG TPA: cation diffusion facilitator family transporter [Candidatus Acidoferrales bacterium]|jgi:cation diffusion facilitator family transporter|nr:cation diffusion facilitator family transporter [Candidatus Acidoferrales bacterium]
MPNRLQRGLRAIFLGIAVNVILGAAKFLAGIFGHSHALIADATESFADIFNSLIIWRGIAVAAEPADEEHPYGHTKAEPLAAAFGAIMLLVAAIWITVKGTVDIYQWAHGIPREQPSWFTLIALAVVVLVKEAMFRYVVSEGTDTDNAAVKTDAWHHRSDAISSVGAAIGITIALLGGSKFVCADDVAAVFAAFIIGWTGWLLLRPALSELMDKAPGPQVIGQIREIALGVHGVANVEKCFARKAGHLLFVEMHVEVDPEMTVRRSHEIAHDVKDKIREIMPTVGDVLVHIEPLGIPARSRKV